MSDVQWKITIGLVSATLLVKITTVYERGRIF
jgi:hypothetical protein